MARGARLLVLVLAAAGCSGASSNRSGPDATPFALRPCPEDFAGARCGTLDVPADPARPDGRTIRLAVVVVEALEPRPNAVPLFHLEGGPGVPASGAVPFYLGPGREYRRGRDVVMVDQRGTGGSGALRCPALEARGALVDAYASADVTACRDRLAERADLGRYGTELAAADLDRVRAALGYAQIDLWALSYGTQLAQVYLRAFPGRVRRAVLTGVAPLDLKTPLTHARNAQRVLDLLFDQCQADPTCHAAFPGLRTSWQRLLARVEAGAFGSIGRGPFAEAVRKLLGTTAQQRQLPALIDRAERGDTGPLLAALDGPRAPVADGMYLSNACAEGTLRIAPDEIAPATAGTFLGDYRVRNQLDACRLWRVVPAPAAFFAPVRSRAAVLVLSGGMDATTPPAYARDVCAMLGHCRLVEFPFLAHGPFDLDAWQGGECFDRVAIAFYEAADPARVDTSCVAAMRPPPFAVF